MKRGMFISLIAWFFVCSAAYADPPFEPICDCNDIQTEDCTHKEICECEGHWWSEVDQQCFFGNELFRPAFCDEDSFFYDPEQCFYWCIEVPEFGCEDGICNSGMHGVGVGDWCDCLDDPEDCDCDEPWMAGHPNCDDDDDDDGDGDGTPGPGGGGPGGTWDDGDGGNDPPDGPPGDEPGGHDPPDGDGSGDDDPTFPGGSGGGGGGPGEPPDPDDPLEPDDEPPLGEDCCEKLLEALDRIDWRLFAIQKQRRDIFEWEKWAFRQNQIDIERLQYGLGVHPLMEQAPYLYYIWQMQIQMRDHREEIYQSEREFFDFQFQWVRHALGVSGGGPGYLWYIGQDLNWIVSFLQQMTDFSVPGMPQVEEPGLAEQIGDADSLEYEPGTVATRLRNTVLEHDSDVFIPTGWYGSVPTSPPVWNVPISASRYNFTLSIDWSFWASFRSLVQIPIMLAAAAWGCAQIWEELRRYG